MTWDWPEAAGEEIAGNALLHLRLSASSAVATVSAKLCDVSPDGTSTLITRGSLNLTRRGGMDIAQSVPIGEPIEFTLELEATAWRILPGQSLRLSIAGTDWPNVAAPPGPVTLTIHGGTLELPTYDATASQFPAPSFTPGDVVGGEDLDGVLWSTTRDVLRRTTSCAVDHGSSYDNPYGSVTEHYGGIVAINTVTFVQTADADVSFSLRYSDDSTGSEVVATARSSLKVRADESVYDVTIELECLEGDQQIAHRQWHRLIPRDLA